jgi:DNA-binding transcriptional LysR family regulator
MHIETLKVFCDLVEMQSFSLAAERNFVTQSAVSQQVRTLEERFENILEAYGQLNENMNSLVGRISGVVKIATVYSVGLHELPPIVREFMLKFPTAKIDLEYQRTTRVIRDVLKGVVELGIVSFPESRRGLTIVPMASDRLVLICPPDHDLAKRKQVKVRELKGQDFVLFERDIPTRKATDRILKSYGVSVNKAAEFDNIETIKRAVEVGFGLAIVPHPSVMDEERNGQLSVVKFKEKDWKRPVGVVFRSDRELSLAAKKFVKLLENHASN